MGRIWLIAALATACAGAGREPALEQPALGQLPTTFEACVAAGGRAEPAARGGRCYLQIPKRRDASAYLHCRTAGGVQRAAGPAGGAGAADSHVCTLIFEPD
jgi:hypothetical protein